MTRNDLSDAEPRRRPAHQRKKAKSPPLLRATYRLQFNKDFRFADAIRIVPYLSALGISHVYASPLLMARPGSTHGYDIVDHNRLDPEIGDERDFAAMIDALHRHGMGLVLDFVPNHMGIGADNRWWVDVLEWGRQSDYADFFDIDWEPAEPTLRGRVLLPVLGDHYGAVLERGELVVRLDSVAGSFAVHYAENCFPLSPRDYSSILEAAAKRSLRATRQLRPAIVASRELAVRDTGTHDTASRSERANDLKRRIALAAASPGVATAIDAALSALNGEVGAPRTFGDLDALLERQAYRLAFWRVAAHEINYRRFFDINDLAGLRMENPVLFEASHRLVLRMIAAGTVQGLRLDHVDGLRDPLEYLNRLAAVMPASQEDDRHRPGRSPIFVEKILARHENLRHEWPVSGTTGYEFMAAVNGLFVDPAGSGPLTRCNERFLERSSDLDEIIIEAKRLVMRESLAGELTVLANAFNRIAKMDRRTRDYSTIGLRDALSDVAAHFPVYRTYVTEQGCAAEDRKALDWAVGRARRNSRRADRSVFDFVYDVLTLDVLTKPGAAYSARDVVDAALKFQQYTGPLMAKAVEDTAFYRYLRLSSLNEVGDDPGRFGVTPAAYHDASRHRLDRHPFSLLATATHDHKRGEDTRARLDVLSELPGEWSRQVRRWSRFNRRKKRDVDDRIAPSRNDEYLFYQTIVGAWPVDLAGPGFDGIERFAARIDAYMRKAAREAKLRTSWASPDEEYEAAIGQFVARVLDPTQSRPFLESVFAFVELIAPAGAVNGLAQTLLKLTCPGVPDIYQGTELWDFSLVDPDNRRPVDYALRDRVLRCEDARNTVAGFRNSWRDGRIKQHVIKRALALRARHPMLFAAGGYRPLATEGAEGLRVVSFVREFGNRFAIIVVPRLVQRMTSAGSPMLHGWDDTCVRLPEHLGAGGPLYDVVTDREVNCAPDGALWLGDLLSEAPVALLVPADRKL